MPDTLDDKLSRALNTDPELRRLMGLILYLQPRVKEAYESYKSLERRLRDLEWQHTNRLNAILTPTPTQEDAGHEDR